MAWRKPVSVRRVLARAGAVTEPGDWSMPASSTISVASSNPHLHTHAVIVNAAQRRDGSWVALHNPALWKRSSLIGAAYHAELRAELGRLGYNTEINGKHGQFDIVGVPRGVIEAFSARRGGDPAQS